MFKTIDDEKAAIKKLYKETQDPVLAIHLMALGRSINELLERGDLIIFDILNEENLKKVLDNIDYDKINKWLKRKGYLEDDTDELLF